MADAEDRASPVNIVKNYKVPTGEQSYRIPAQPIQVINLLCHFDCGEALLLPPHSRLFHWPQRECREIITPRKQNVIMPPCIAALQRYTDT